MQMNKIIWSSRKADQSAVAAINRALRGFAAMHAHP
jgi:hypothetical protein